MAQKSIESEFLSITVFHVELKNGITYDHENPIVGDIELVGDHLIIKDSGRFKAAFALSEIVSAGSTTMYRHRIGYLITPTEMEALRKHQRALERHEIRLAANAEGHP